MDRSPFSVTIVTKVRKDILLILSALEKIPLYLGKWSTDEKRSLHNRQRNSFFLGIVYPTFTERVSRHKLFK